MSLHRQLAKRERGQPQHFLPSRRAEVDRRVLSRMTTEVPPSLPEEIAPADLEALNQALAGLFKELRSALSLPSDQTHERLRAVAALSSVWRFLTRFESVLAESLHVPLMSLHSALLALNENNVEPILMPTKRTGRTTSSPRRYALIGIAVGSARRLEWTGLSPMDANKAVATKLNALGVNPTRGKGGITADTLRRWRNQISATQPLLRSLPQMLPSELSTEDLGWINAAINADSMMTEKWHARIAARPAADARRFVLLALEKSISEMTLADLPKPPS
jgi:hypothetical protein